MEFPLITKQMKRFAYILTFINVLFFSTLMVLWFIQDTADNSLQMNQFIFFVCIILIYIPFMHKMQIGEWGGKKARIIIDERGIDFKTKKKHKHMDWIDIEYIVIVKGQKAMWIRFFTHDYEDDGSKMPYLQFPRENVSFVTDSYIYMRYNCEALTLIKKYFDKPIIDEYKLYLKRTGL